MALALPRTLDKARAKEREQLAAKAGALYRAEVEDCTYLSISPVKTGNGFKPVVRWGDERAPAWEGPIYTMAKERSLAQLHAEIAADQYRRYYLMHDHKRYEVVLREEWQAQQDEKRRLMDLRKALTDDRLAIYDALAALVSIIPDPMMGSPNSDSRAVLNEARRLIDLHRDGAEALRSAISGKAA